MTERQKYGLGRLAAERAIAAPRLDYRPREPRAYAPGIGLIGCGGVTEQHLAAYRAAGYRVLALCSRTEASARRRQSEFYPEADVYTDYRDVLARDDVEVVDVATHPEERTPIVAAALRACKHVLSQKPFALDLVDGERLAVTFGNWLFTVDPETLGPLYFFNAPPRSDCR